MDCGGRVVHFYTTISSGREKVSEKVLRFRKMEQLLTKSDAKLQGQMEKTSNK